jgi:alpha,alpha-trehalose phosphorylase
LTCEPWALRETQLDLDRLAQTESLFALANGHIGLRGNLDEGDPSRCLGPTWRGSTRSRATHPPTGPALPVVSTPRC